MLESVQNYFFFLSFITIHKVHGAKLSYSQQVPTTHGLLMTALSYATLLPIFWWIIPLSSYDTTICVIRELKKRRRRSRGQRRLKSEFMFYLRISRRSKVIYVVSRCQNSQNLNMEHSVKLEKEIKKNSRRRSRSPDSAKFGHFTLLFCRGRKAIVQLIRPFFLWRCLCRCRCRRGFLKLLDMYTVQRRLFSFHANLFEVDMYLHVLCSCNVARVVHKYTKR